jgi:AcrR family transcriptional regulator
MSETPRRSDARRNGARIVAAAVSAFADEGPAVRLDDLAARAGVGVATVYRLFGGRDGLVKAAFETVFGTEVEPIALAARAEPDPAVGLRAALAGTLEKLAAHRALFRAAREAGVIRVDVVERFLRDLGDVLGAAQGAGAVRLDVGLRDLAAMLVMALSVMHDNDPDGADRRRFLALLLDGLRPGAAPLPPPTTIRPMAAWAPARDPAPAGGGGGSTVAEL